MEPMALSPFELLPCEGTGVTADKMCLSKKLMTREQAIKMLAIAADKPKGTIRAEFLAEARMVLNADK